MEQLRDALALVVLQVVIVCRLQGNMRPLQFDEDQGNPIDEAEQVTAALVHLPRHPHLLGKEEVVVLRGVPVDDRKLHRLRVAFVVGDFYLHPIPQQVVEGLVGIDRYLLGAVLGQLLDGLFIGRGWVAGIDALQCLAKSTHEDDLGGRLAAFRTIRPEGLVVEVRRLPAKGCETVDRG